MSETLDFEKDSVDWPHRAYSQIIETPEIRWHVQIAGNGPPLLLLHGTGSSTHTWAGLLPLLKEHYTVVAPDLPGQGFSRTKSLNTFSMLSMGLAVSSLLKKLGLTPKSVIGHSAGAALLARMILQAQIHPQCLVSLNGAFFPFGGALTQFFSPLAKVLALNPIVPHFFTWGAKDRASVQRLLSSTGSHIPETSVDLYQRLFRCPSHVSSTLAMMASWDLETLLQDLPKLSLPILLLVGENDKTIDPLDGTRLKTLLGSSSLVSLPHLGHLAHEEDPVRVAEPLLKFLRSTLS